MIVSGELEKSTTAFAAAVASAEPVLKPFAMASWPEARATMPTAPEARATPPSGMETTPELALSPLSPMAPTAMLVCFEAAEAFCGELGVGGGRDGCQEHRSQNQAHWKSPSLIDSV